MLKNLKRMFSVILCVVLLVSTMCYTSFSSSAAKIVDSYTVLVLDTSGSMSGDPIVALQDVAKRFCASLLGADSVNEIAIVDFDTSCTSIGFTGDYSALKSKIEALEAGGNTNMYDALTTAASLLSNVSASATRNIVLLSDGVPQSGTKSDDGPYEKGTGSASWFGYHKYANAVYNLMEEYKQTYDVYTVGFFHKSTSSLASELLNDINNKGYYDAQNASDLTFMFSNIADSVNKKTPKDYDFFEDSYNFTNYTVSKLSSKYFTTLYEPGPGLSLYNENKGAGKKGLCFGFAYTTASIYNGFPSAERWSWSKLFGTEYAQSIRDLKNMIDPHGVRVSSTVSLYNDMVITLDDYIKYAFLYQMSTELSDDISNTENDVEGLKNLVNAYVKANQMGIILNIFRYDMDENGNRKINEKGNYVTLSGHSILVVGIDGNDLLIDDPNSSADYERLTINPDGSWEYSRPWESGGINNENSDFYYCTNYYRPYQLLLTGTSTTAREGFFPDENANTISVTETFVEGMEKLSTEHLLFATDSSSFAIDATDVSPVMLFNTNNNSSNESKREYFWIKNSTSLNVSNLINDENFIEISGDDTIFSANLSKDSEISVNIDDSNKNAVITSDVGTPITTSITNVDENGEHNKVTISGTVASDNITINDTNSGVSIDGVNNLSVTLETSNGVSDSIKANVVDGREVNITVDENNDTVKTDFVDENACGYCGKVHGNSFFEMLIKFIHSIFNFFVNSFKF